MLAGKRDTQPAEEAREHPSVTAASCARTPSLRKDRGAGTRRSSASSSPTAARSRSGSSAPVGSSGSRPSPSTATPTRTRSMSGSPTSRSAIGPAPAAESYLRVDAIVAAAHATGAEAIHPGLRLPRRAGVVRARRRGRRDRLRRPVERDDRALGDKLAARRPRAAAGVPVVPGTLEPSPSTDPDAVEAILAAARDASASRCSSRRRPAEAGAGCAASRRRRAAGRAGGRVGRGAGGVRRRRRLSRAGDRAGPPHRGPAPRRRPRARSSRSASATARSSAGTRSSSRRRPRPVLTEDERRALHELAVRAARAAGLATRRRPSSCSTRTAVLVPRGQHPAPGRARRHRARVGRRPRRASSSGSRRAPLSPARPRRGRARPPIRPATRSRSGSRPRTRRVDFAPTPGRDRSLGDAVRARASGSTRAVEAGDRVPPDYDPLIAKLMVVARDRDARDRPPARGRSTRPRSAGIQTTLPFHRFVAPDAGSAPVTLSIDWVDDDWNGGRGGPARAAALATAPRELRAASRAVADPGVEAADPVVLAQRPRATARDAGDRVDDGAGAADRPSIDRWPR